MIKKNEKKRKMDFLTKLNFLEIWYKWRRWKKKLKNEK